MTEEYIKRVRKGDLDAFRFIISDWKDAAFTLAISVVKDEHHAADVVQGAFVKAYLKLDSFKGKASFATWFYRIVVNEAFMDLRKRKKKILSLEETDWSPVSKMHDPETEEFREYYINEVLKRMDSGESLALRLFYLEDLSVKEITEVTGWSQSKVKVILHRARISFKEMLQSVFRIKKEDLLA
ncbi:MAG: sigma-70 family RNA polymerase sigma factor [Cyclonatronaceae bacterium]